VSFYVCYYERRIKMPYNQYKSSWWNCSWKCGYKNKDVEKVIEHENKTHGAIARKEEGKKK